MSSVVAQLGRKSVLPDSQDLGMLSDSSSICTDFKRLFERLNEDGYLLLRGLQDRVTVQAARELVLHNLSAGGQLAEDIEFNRGVAAPGAQGAFMGGSRELTRSELFLDLVESPQIMGFFANLLRASVITYDYKWLRAVGPGDHTGCHYDIVYMGRGTPNVYTCWTPLGDVTYDMGPLTILSGSQTLERIRATYGQMDVDRDHVTGAFEDDPLTMSGQYGGKWLTEEFRAGDVLIFTMFTMHASLTNITDRYRLSCDTRYQRADEPVDERWVGDNPPAHYAWMQGTTVTMKDARTHWGV